MSACFLILSPIPDSMAITGCCSDDDSRIRVCLLALRCLLSAQRRFDRFSDALGVVNLSEDEKISANTLSIIENEVKSFITDAQSRATELLTTRSVELNRLAEALIHYESLTLPEVQKVIKGEKLEREM